MVVETLVGNITDVATEVLSNVIPFAGTAIKILQMIMGQGSKAEAAKQKEEEEKKRMADIINKTQQMFWAYDHWKTKQEFNIDVAGVLAELKFMNKKPESSEVWK